VVDEAEAEEESNEIDSDSHHGHTPASAAVKDLGVDFGSFIDFRSSLSLACEESVNTSAAVFQFTPSVDTPNELYFNSYNNYQMGSRIFIVDEFPLDLKHIVEEPYRYDARQHQTRQQLARENSSPSSLHSAPTLLFSVIFILASCLLL